MPAGIKQYTIQINGISESVSQIDALLAKLNALEQKIGAISGIETPSLPSPSVTPPSLPSSGVEQQQVQAAQQLKQVQAEVVVEIEKQNAAISQQNQLVQEGLSVNREALQVADDILGTYDDNIAKLASLDAQLKSIKAERKAIAEEAEVGLISTDEEKQRLNELLAKEIKLKQERSDVNSILKNQANLLNAQEGSYDEMSAALGRMKDALRAAGDSLTPEQFQKVSAAVDELDKGLKDADASMGNFQRNVGNYASAAEGFNKIKVSINGTVQEFDSARTAIAALRNAMAQLAVEGKTDTEEYRGLADQMQRMQLAMATVNDEIERSKDASSGLHDTIETLQGLVAIGTIGQGFSNLFGIDDSALTEQINKITSLMGILQGLNELKNQIATGTGIGPALKKVLDFTGISSSVKDVTTGVKELASRMGLIPPAANSAAAGMTTFAVATKVATAAVKTFWRALLIGVAIEAVMFVIDGIVEGVKALYNVLHNYFSISDDVERSNKAMADSYDNLKSSIEGYNDARDRDVARGVMTQYQADADKLHNLNEELKKRADLTKENIALAAQDAGIKPALADWTRLVQEVENINRLQNIGREETSAWGEVYKSVLADVVARMQELDATDEAAIARFMQWVKDSDEVKSAITWALNSGDDSMKRLAESIQNGTANAADLVSMIYQVRDAMAAAEKAAADFDKKWDYIQKYGKNAQNELSRERELQQLEENNKNGRYNEEGEYERRKKLINDYYDNAEKAHSSGGRKIAAANKRTANDIVRIQRQMRDDEIAVMNDGLAKKLALIEEERRRRIGEYQKMAIDSETRNRAIQLVNERYDKAALDARREWREQFLKEEEEFNDKLKTLQSDVAKGDTQYSIDDNDLTLLKKSSETSKIYGETLLNVGIGTESMVDTFKRLGEEQDKVYAKYMKLEDEVLKLQVELNKNRYDHDDEDAYDRTEKMLEQKKIELAEALAAVKKVDKELVEANRKLNSKGIDDVMMLPSMSYKTYSEYYLSLYNLRQESMQKEIDLQKKMNDLMLDDELSALEKSLKQETDSLMKRREEILGDSEAISEYAKTRVDAINKLMEGDLENDERERLEREVEQWQDASLQKEKVEEDLWDKVMSIKLEYDNKMSNSIKSAELEEERLIQEGNEKNKQLYADYYRDIMSIQTMYIGRIEESVNNMKTLFTNDWGLFDISKFREDKELALYEMKKLRDGVETELASIRAAFLAGQMSFEEYTKAYDEMDKLMKRINDEVSKLGKDNGWEDFFKGVDEWVQRLGQAVNDVLSAVFDVRNSEFEKMKEDLDKEIDLVQEKYDEMEELANKHKDNINAIEDELNSARGDRRAHLIDALSLEIEAQRRALAEQKKAEKEKERLERQSDRLELQRKKEQKRQSLITATINAALAISQAAANKYPVPAIPLIALATAVGAAQIAAISAQQYRKGGLLQGPDHEHGGIKVGHGIEVEGGEFVTNKRTTAKNLAVLEFINSKKKKLDVTDFISFYSSGKNRGKQKPKFKYAEGGVLQPSLEIADRVSQVIIERDDRPIYVAVTDINKAQDNLRNVQTLAGL